MTQLKFTLFASMLTVIIASCSTETPAVDEQLVENETTTSACCGSNDESTFGEEHETSGCAPAENSTVGCTPSNCRGEKTKFGEAEVITDLRLDLIDLKAQMEQYESTAFSSRSYDIHGIVGETDEESIAIIVEEVKIIEAEFSEKIGSTFSNLELPDQKAKQIKYLDERISELRNLL